MIRWLGRLIGLLLLLAILGGGWFLWFAATLPGPAPDALRTDGIVVLTGGPGRLARGVALMRGKAAERMLVSGVDRSVKARELAKEAAVPPDLLACCIDLGREAVDTRSNAQETADWVRRNHYRSLRLVTSADHMARARLELASVLDPKVAILDDAVPRDRSRRDLAREFGKYALRRAAVPVGL